jgi:hypothetical protein
MFHMDYAFFLRNPYPPCKIATRPIINGIGNRCFMETIIIIEPSKTKNILIVFLVKI